MPIAASLLTLLAAAAPLAPDACNGAFQTVLKAEAALPAQAVWLDAGRLQWPGNDGKGSFRLYFAAQGGISAVPGAAVSGADGALALQPDSAPPAARDRFGYLAAGPVLAVSDLTRIKELHRGQLVLVQEDDGKVVRATRVQAAGALDDLYAPAARLSDFGARPGPRGTTFRVWAPTAREASVCIYDSGFGKARARLPLQFDPATGSWHARSIDDLSGKYYTYLVDVQADGVGLVRNLVPDPYAVSATANSARGYIANLEAAALKPAGWDAQAAPRTVKSNTDMAIYELHVRDFSINDDSVPAAHRGKYLAFTDGDARGMRHLRALQRAGLTDVHLLPVFDFGSVPELGCVTPHPAGAPDGESQQAAVQAVKERDCFNWGYDPVLYNSPEGSYSTDPRDGAKRILELRAAVLALHRAGLRVGMDVVYNHTFRAGQREGAVLDRVVPGYYHRLDAQGGIEQSTCCDNTATENLMMAKLMTDSVALWATQYRIDSFRFDLMGHQPRAVMEALRREAERAAGRPVQMIGEGWNFGEVADGKRFVQASQLSLNGSGIGTFSDRARDAVRGGGAADSGLAMFNRHGYLNGIADRADKARTADLVRLGLAGSVRTYRLQTFDGAVRALADIDYAGQPAGYASEPGEAVNYVENHDNQTLFDINVLKLPPATTSAERARVQMLGAAINMFSQGVAYFHAGIDTLRSKSLDRNSFNSGDWFNRIDWSYQDNYFGSGLPQRDDNGADWPLLKPLLADRGIKPHPVDIAFARDVFRDLLAVRASSSLFRMSSSADIAQRLRFYNTGPQQEPGLIAAALDGRGYPGARFALIAYFINVDPDAHTLAIPELAARKWRLHPALQADARVREAQQAGGSFTIPARTAVVFVAD
ncbi:MAG TPA: alpha-1,6-glucosidase domain-containing protein [Telluria sp.]|nr:alpha-1,6-glucosidase domain-containing protein [Telluria sp.]